MRENILRSRERRKRERERRREKEGEERKKRRREERKREKERKVCNFSSISSQENNQSLWTSVSHPFKRLIYFQFESMKQNVSTFSPPFLFFSTLSVCLSLSLSFFFFFKRERRKNEGMFHLTDYHSCKFFIFFLSIIKSHSNPFVRKDCFCTLN